MLGGGRLTASNMVTEFLRCLYVSHFSALHISRNHQPSCQLPSGMSFHCQEKCPTYPCKHGSLSPSPKQKMTKPISSIILLFVLMQVVLIVCWAVEDKDPSRFVPWSWSNDSRTSSSSKLHSLNFIFGVPQYICKERENLHVKISLCTVIS